MCIFLSLNTVKIYDVLFCHDPLSQLAINASSCIHEGVDESLRKICKYQQNVL